MEIKDSGTADGLEAFARTLEQLSALIASIAQIEEAKAEAASTRQHHRIDGYLQQEQAMLLKLRGLEQTHGRQMEALGFKGLTFRQILDDTGEEEKRLLSPLFDRLTRELKRLTDSRETADRILRLRLKEFEDALAGSPRPHYRDIYV